MIDKRLARRIGVAMAAVILGSLIGYYLSASRLENSGKDYSEQAVAQILDAWSDRELLNRASPQFRDVVDPNVLHAGFDVLSHRLGRVRSCSAAQGSLKRDEGKPVTARYDVPCRFDRGEATIRINLIRDGSVWRILGFTVDSPALRRGDAPTNGLQPYKGDQT